jgi:putative SOS response-associated peptidase YedK
MCGRFTLRTPASDLVEIFHLLRMPELAPRYNIAPTQPVAAVRQIGQNRELSLFQWSLIPSWAKDPRMGAQMINARAESIATKPSFRSAFKRRRCLIPADGFYEWQQTGAKAKQPFYIRLAKDRPFAFAGLWERWEGADSTAVESCTIITTDANELLRPLHDRMPVILPEQEYDRWLDPPLDDPVKLQALLKPDPAEEMTAYPVSTFVNSPRNESPRCIEAVDPSSGPPSQSPSPTC